MIRITSKVLCARYLIRNLQAITGILTFILVYFILQFRTDKKNFSEFETRDINSFSFFRFNIESVRICENNSIEIFLWLEYGEETETIIPIISKKKQSKTFNPRKKRKTKNLNILIFCPITLQSISIRRSTTIRYSKRNTSVGSNDAPSLGSTRIGWTLLNSKAEQQFERPCWGVCVLAEHFYQQTRRDLRGGVINDSLLPLMRRQAH